MAALENWDFEHVKPTLVRHARDRGIIYDPTHPLRGFGDYYAAKAKEKDEAKAEKKAAGDLVKRAFVALSPDYTYQKNVAKDAAVDQSLVSYWYRGDFQETGLRTIFGALCDGYVRAFCEPEPIEGAVYHYPSGVYPTYPPTSEFRTYLLKVPDGEKPSFISALDIELAALSLLLTGSPDDPYITKSPAGYDSWNLPDAKSRFQRDVLRLASSVLEGGELESVANVAFDYIRLAWYKSTADDQLHGEFLRCNEYNLEAHGITRNGLYFSKFAADYDRWAKQVEEVWLGAMTNDELHDLADAIGAELDRRQAME